MCLSPDGADGSSWQEVLWCKSQSDLGNEAVSSLFSSAEIFDTLSAAATVFTLVCFHVKTLLITLTTSKSLETLKPLF